MAVDYTPSAPFLKMTEQNITHAFGGILTGIIINQLGSQVYDRLQITDKNIKIIGQIILCSIFLAFVHTKVNNRYGWEWQNVTPGLFFTAFFFGIQYVSFTAIQDVYGIKRM